jgi:hypothetical protein
MRRGAEEAMTGPHDAEPDTGRRRSTDASNARNVRDREVVLLAACCVALVLGLQLLGIVYPPFAAALGRPPTMIVALVVVTAVVLGRALWAAGRRP